MLTAGAENKTRLRPWMGRALLLVLLACVLVAATAGIVALAKLQPSHLKRRVSVEEFARLLRDDLRHGGVVERCSPYCFDRNRGYQGWRVLAP